jgi:hypothetical protein
MSILAAETTHGPGGAAHLFLLAGIVVTALVIFGVNWWRGRRDASANEDQSSFDDRAHASTRSTEEE